MNKPMALLASILCLFLGAWTHGVAGAAAPATCPFATDNGCAAANQNSTYLLGSNLTNVVSNVILGGQPTTLNTHPMTTNLPGIDYPVGYFTPKASLIDPSVSQPAHCTYSATGNGAGHPRLDCSFAGTIDVEGYDFSKGPNGCINLRIESNVTHLILKNNFHQMNSGCDYQADVEALVYIVSNTCADLDMEWNTYDGNFAAFVPTNAMFGLFGDNRNGCSSDTVRKYNVFLDAPDRPISGAIWGTELVAFNVWRGFCLNCTTTLTHGEIEQLSPNPGGTLSSDVTYQGNVTVTTLAGNYPSAAFGNATSIAIFSVPPGNNYTFNTLTIKDNLLISNLQGNGITTSSTLVANWYNSFTVVTYTNNWLDPSGAFTCYTNNNPNSVFAGGQPTWTGDKNLRDGSTTTGFSGTCAGHQ